MKFFHFALIGLSALAAYAHAAEQTAIPNACAQANVANSSTVVALLDCPTIGRSEVETTIAVYDATKPICSAKIKLLDGSSNFFRAGVKSVEARSSTDKSLLIVPMLAGGDGTLPWTAHAIVRIDERCGLTLLARTYSRMHYDEDDTSKCEGEKHKLSFVSDDIVEVRRDRVHCTPTDEHAEPQPPKRLDLRDLMTHPEHRSIEP